MNTTTLLRIDKNSNFTHKSPKLEWGAFDESGKLRAILESESEAYFYVKNRGHMLNGSHRKIEILQPEIDPERAQQVDWQNTDEEKYAYAYTECLKELETIKAHAQRLAEALAIIRAEMNALYRDEPKPDKRLSRLGARFDWNLVVYEPLAAWEGTQS